MKKTDIAMIIFIASVSTMVSYFITDAIMGDTVSKPVQVETAKRIESDVEKPDKKIFNSEAINPTVEVMIGSDAEAADPAADQAAPAENDTTQNQTNTNQQQSTTP